MVYAHMISSAIRERVRSSGIWRKTFHFKTSGNDELGRESLNFLYSVLKTSGQEMEAIS